MNVSAEQDMPIRGLTPTPDEAEHFREFRAEPHLGPAYAYRAVLPSDWNEIAVATSPARVPRQKDFVVIGAFSPYVPPVPPVIVSFGVCLLSADSDLSDASRSYCEEQSLEVLFVRPQLYVGGEVIECLAQKQDPIFGLLKMRLALFEDGGRLFGLSGMAPALLYSDFVRPMSLAMLSFELKCPHAKRSSSSCGSALRNWE